MSNNLPDDHRVPTWAYIFVALIGAVALIIAALINRPPNSPSVTSSPPTEEPQTSEAVVESQPEPSAQPDSIATNPISTIPPEPAPTMVDCSTLIEGTHHFPTLGTNWEFKADNEDRIIHIWSNHWDPNLPEYKFFLPAGQTVSFMSGGGSFWMDRPGCDGVAKVLFERDTFEEITNEEYQKYIEQQTIP